MTELYLLAVISSCLNFRLLRANYMNVGISFKVVRIPYWRSLSIWKPWWKTHICLLHYIIMQILF